MGLKAHGIGMRIFKSHQDTFLLGYATERYCQLQFTTNSRFWLGHIHEQGCVSLPQSWAMAILSAKDSSSMSKNIVRICLRTNTRRFVEHSENMSPSNGGACGCITPNSRWSVFCSIWKRGGHISESNWQKASKIPSKQHQEWPLLKIFHPAIQIQKFHVCKYKCL